MLMIHCVHWCQNLTVASVLLLIHKILSSCQRVYVRAMQAAEARAKKQNLMSSGPRKVGGDLSLLKTLTPAQVRIFCFVKGMWTLPCMLESTLKCVCVSICTTQVASELRGLCCCYLCLMTCRKF